MMDFINKVEGFEFNPSHQTMVTMDVVSLYTQIPQEEALEVLESYLEGRARPHQVPTQFILNLASLALKKNYFKFDNDVVKKVQVPVD